MEGKTVRSSRQAYKFQPREGHTWQEQLLCARIKSCCLVGHNRSWRRKVCFKRATICMMLPLSFQSFEAQRFLELDITLPGLCCPRVVHSPFEPLSSPLAPTAAFSQKWLLKSFMLHMNALPCFPQFISFQANKSQSTIIPCKKGWLHPCGHLSLPSPNLLQSVVIFL